MQEYSEADISVLEEDPVRPMLRLFVTLVLVVGLLVPSPAAAGPGEKGRPWAQDPPVNEMFKATEPPELTVDPLPRETTARAIVVRGHAANGARVFISLGGQIVSAGLPDQFSARTDLALGENEILVEAEGPGGARSVSRLLVRRMEAPPVALLTEPRLSVEAGASVALPVTVIDSNGDEVSGVPIVAMIDPADLGTYSPGRFEAGTRSGKGVVTLIAAGLSAAVPVVVNPGPPVALRVEPGTISMPAGSSVQFSAIGTDGYGNAFTISDAQWSATGGVIDTQGRFAALGTGSATVTAQKGELSASAGVNVYGAASKVVILPPATTNLIADGVSTVTVTAQVQDVSGNVAANFHGPVSFVSSNSNVLKVLQSSVNVVGGVASTTVKAGTLSGSTVLSANVTGFAGATLTFSAIRQVVGSVALKADPTVLAAGTGSQGNLWVRLLDQSGALLTGPSPYPVEVTLSTSDSSVVQFTGGASTQTVSLTQPEQVAPVFATTKVGTATITGSATASGSAVPVGTASVGTALVGLPYRLQIEPIPTAMVGTQVPVTVRVLDYSGNQVTTQAASLPVTLTAMKSGATVGSYFAQLAYGQGGTVMTQTIAGSYTLRASAAGLVSTETSWVLTPSAANGLRLTATPAVLAANGVAESTVTVKVLDRFGNPTGGRFPVTLKKTTDNGATQPFPDTTVTTDDSGEATFTVRATGNVGTDGFTATSPGLAAYFITIQTSQMGAPHRLAFQPTYFDAQAGMDALVKVSVQDGTGTTLTYDNGRLVTLQVRDSSNAVVATAAGATENGVAVVPVRLSAAGTYTLRALSDQLVEAAGGTLTVSPGTPAALTLTADPNPVTANGVSRAQLNVCARDAYGNKATFSEPKDVFLSSSNTTVLDFEGGKEAGGNYAGSVRLVLAPGSPCALTTDGTNSLRSTPNVGTATITATMPGAFSGSMNLTSIIIGQPYRLSVPSPADTTAGEQQLITVSLVDAMGNAVTWNSTSTVQLTVEGAGQLPLLTHSGAPYTPGTPVSLVKGQTKFYAKSAAAATFTYTLTTDAIAGHSMQVTGRFVPGPAARVILVPPAPLAADGSSVALLTAKIVDSQENLVTTFTGPVQFTVTSGMNATLLSSSADVSGGVAQVQVQAGRYAGTERVVGKAQLPDGTWLAPGEAVITVTELPVEKIALATDTPVLTADSESRGRLTLRLLGPGGRAVGPLEPIPVTLTSSNPGVVHFGNGLGTLDLSMAESTREIAIFAAAQAGNAVITAVPSSPLLGSNLTIDTVVAGTAGGIRFDEISAAPIGASVEAIVRLVDANGNPVTRTETRTATVTLTSVDGTEPHFVSTPVELVDGVGRFTFQAPVVTGDYRLTAATEIGTAEAVFAVTAGGPAALRLRATPLELAADGRATSVLTAQILDAAGNAVTDGAYAIRFLKVADNGVTAGNLPTTVQSEGGQASITVQATTKLGTDTYQAVIPELLHEVAGSTISISTVIYGIPVQVGVKEPLPVVAAGNPVTVKVGVQDASGRWITSDQGRPVVAELWSAEQLVGSGIALTVNGVASITFTPTRSGAYTVRPSAEGLKSAGPASLQVLGGPPAALRVSIDRNPLEVSPASRGTVKVRVVDAWENPTTWSGDVQVSSSNFRFESGQRNVTLTMSGPSVSTTDGANSLVPGDAAGSTVLAATAPGLASGSLTVSSVVAGSPYALTVPALSPTRVGQQQFLTVSLEDSNGILKSSDSSSTVRLTLNEGAQVSLFVQTPTGLTAYQAGADVTFHKGRVTFVVESAKAGTLTYTLTSSQSGYELTREVTGTFLPGPAEKVLLQASPGSIPGNGSNLSVVKARIADLFGNTVTSFTGTVTFEIVSGNDFAFLQTTSAPIVGGEAAVVVQSRVVMASGSVVIRGRSKAPDGSWLQEGTTTLLIEMP